MEFCYEEHRQLEEYPREEKSWEDEQHQERRENGHFRSRTSSFLHKHSRSFFRSKDAFPSASDRILPRWQKKSNLLQRPKEMSSSYIITAVCLFIIGQIIFRTNSQCKVLCFISACFVASRQHDRGAVRRTHAATDVQRRAASTSPSRC